MIGGTFDIIHYGHITALKEAKSLGDILVVVIASNSTVIENKRKPVFDQETRLKMIQSLKITDLGLLGDKKDHLKSVEKIKPDLIAIGFNQNYLKEDLESRVNNLKIPKVDVIRLKSNYNNFSTSAIIEKLKEKA